MSHEASSESTVKIKYFDSLAKRLVPEMRLLFRGGKLWSKDDWRNVAEHSLVQAAAAQAVSELHTESR